MSALFYEIMAYEKQAFSTSFASWRYLAHLLQRQVHLECNYLLSPIRFMQDAVKERWMELCALAAQEQDSHKLMALVEEINRLLEEKERRLKARAAAADQSSTK